jgi:hypothetical protein
MATNPETQDTNAVPIRIISSGTFTPSAYNGIDGNSVVPASGYFSSSWPANGAIPQSISAGGWTIDTQTKDRGFVQQTFLGASIRNFGMNGGFGDSSSTLTVDLIVDEYNKSDSTLAGLGDDVYHSGQHDFFRPPIAGSPVFFKFGPNHATVEQAYRKTFDDIYMPPGSGTLDRMRGIKLDDILNAGGGKYDSLVYNTYTPGDFVDLENNRIYNLLSYTDPKNPKRGENHITFGGILQSYIQNRGPNGNPLYSVQVVDPREILSNVTIILNNYAESTYGAKNIFNVYGFLEYNFSTATSGTLNSYYSNGANHLTKMVSGDIAYVGSRQNGQPPLPANLTPPYDVWFKRKLNFADFNSMYQVEYFPFTGTGYSRRGKQGIPYYRVAQALSALMEEQYDLPEEYKKIGFGGKINFRGYNYVVDLSGLPQLPSLYYLDFDQITLLDLCLEICDVTSKDLFVTLLPVINHPACSFLYNQNKTSNAANFIAGIIRVDTIDRSQAPVYGSIKTYIDNLAGQGIYVENQDIGYELSNVVTDKFVTGAQEIDMYFFSGNADRDIIDSRLRRNGNLSGSTREDQWRLHKQLEQQILPYYGKLGQQAVTIPKGWGAYQQILLDATSLNANGVGAYYVATEMELRCASVSYDCWKEFLISYNDLYMESMEDDDVFEGAALQSTPAIGGGGVTISNAYGVSVPRSVFETYANTPFGPDGFPKSSCNPPYGYPLYYQRASKIGIPEGGLFKLGAKLQRMMSGAAAVRNADGYNYQEVRNSQWQFLEDMGSDGDGISELESQYYNSISSALSSTPPNVDLLNDLEYSIHAVSATLPRLAKKGTENAMKVYEFVKKIADENLGKKFLVKIPNKPNMYYDNTIAINSAGGQYSTGPFGFPPRPVHSGIDYAFSQPFISMIQSARANTSNNAHAFKSFLNADLPPSTFVPIVGALRGNFNPIADEYQFNYKPTNLGGYYQFDLYSSTLTVAQAQQLQPLGVKQTLVPLDCTNFVNEDGRITPYVRFDNSQELSLGSLNTEDFTQQVITPNGAIPDLCEFLDNVGEDKFESFRGADADRPDVGRRSYKQCAFVKCTVDEIFYMTPKIITSGIVVYGAATGVSQVTKPRKIFIPCSGKQGISLIPGSGTWIDSYAINKVSHRPTTGTVGNVTTSIFNKYYEPELQSWIVDTRFDKLDSDHVYALITLPQKIVATQDSRYRDAINQSESTFDIKHYLTMDVVKGLPEFNSPGFCGKPSMSNLRAGGFNFNSQANSAAWLAQKQAKKNLDFALPQRMQAVSPSPVYPDLVALPLISQERCYGPWISSQVDPQSQSYENIGGKVEFIKDENLAPWNYAGYLLMNEAGVMQAQFANSLLLFSERGGFVVPGMPKVSLCQALLTGGPLVTNIQVDVSDGGIKTTYKMDLYTASFGKLQKQKQDLISKISRERQKLRDERNALIRKGMGKAQTASNVVGNINSLAKSESIQPLMHLVGSISQNPFVGYSPNVGSFGSDDEPSSGPNLSGVTYSNAVSLQPVSQSTDVANSLGEHPMLYGEKMSNAGGSLLSDMFTVYSSEPGYFGVHNMSVENPKKNDLLQ